MRTLSLASCVWLSLLSTVVYGQEQKPTPACRSEVFAALKPLPELKYGCRDGELNDYDEAILRRPERIKAINGYIKTLEAFTYTDWWKYDVEDLNVCYFRGKPGPLDPEEKAKFEGRDYRISLLGHDRIRLLVIPDPCFQRGYDGSNAFLLYRMNGRVRATEVLDGHFSRADNSVGIDFATSNAERIIEVSTATGGLHPYITNYYFVIDRRTGKAVPKNLFKVGRRLTNRITSMMLLGDEEGLPVNAPEMQIIKGGRLARAFNIYEEDRRIDDQGDSPARKVYRWNGRLYVRAR
ncbi:MAG TPA: hypothetical protein VE842_01795 [Pyrinomonadaceae bacterium]|nr:hypothetical protein [Pyrinomonadaceae bacterium]